MLDTATNRDPDACIIKPCNIKDIDSYVVDVTGASVTADSSVSLIHRYCEKLPGDKYGNIVLYQYYFSFCRGLGGGLLIHVKS